MMWQGGSPTYDAVTVNHYLEIITAGILAFAAYVTKQLWQEWRDTVKGHGRTLQNHGRRIGDLEVINGIVTERREPDAPEEA